MDYLGSEHSFKENELEQIYDEKEVTNLTFGFIIASEKVCEAKLNLYYSSFVT